ncbi:MAG: hypothetical protein IKF00_07550 [Solobacterium sp.]|jgi:hypothetical protein|nr:hypothetical protein [Solobacterium sp.]MBR3343759.1 hypothetical protein [Solobacterium sp.]HAE15032.1 hypothetical protein [Erysipelotrichaceae bacterium]
MFPYLIILLKILLAAVAIYRIYVLYRFKKSDTNVKLRFELMSMIELDGGIAFTLVALLAAVNENTYLFTSGLLAVTILLNIAHLCRVIVAGDKRILLGRHAYDLKEIKGMNTSRVTLHVYVYGGERLHILVPLTHNETLQKMKYLK